MSKINYVSTLPTGVGGRCEYPRIPVLNWFGIGTCKISILNKYKNDVGLERHELKHAEQYKKNMFHVLKYKMSKKYRLKCELEAYREQVKVYKYTSISQCDWIVKALVSKYGLGLDEATVVSKVQELLV